MDTTGTAYILIFLVCTVVTILLFWKIDKTWPGGTAVSMIAFGLFVLSIVIPDQNSRELSLLVGFLRINGIIGILLGLVSYIRRKRAGDVVPEVEAEPIPTVQVNPNKCPQCGLVNRIIDASCKRCGTQLQR